MPQSARDADKGSWGKNIAQGFNNMFSEVGNIFTGQRRRENNQIAMDSAQIAHERELSSAREHMAFEASEAQKQRDFQTQMSNTARQRDMADLKAAGLNPVLAAMGSGASTPQGAMAGGSSARAQAADTSHDNSSALLDVLKLVAGTSARALTLVKPPARTTNFHIAKWK